jgi:AhpC/TSA family
MRFGILTAVAAVLVLLNAASVVAQAKSSRDAGGQRQEPASGSPTTSSASASVKSAKTEAETRPSAIPSGLINGAAEPLQATSTDGKSVKFPQGFKGKLVLLYFWSHRSESTVAELTNRAGVYRGFYCRGFDVLGVYLDQADVGDKLARLMQEHKITWPQIYAGKESEGDIATKYFVQSLPRAILVD